MKLSVFFLCFLLSLFAAAQKEELFINIEQNKVKYAEVAQNIWEYARLDIKKKKARRFNFLLRKLVLNIKGVAEIPTAFIAEYNNGGPIIGILGEYGLPKYHKLMRR